MHLVIETEADLNIKDTMTVGYEILVPTDLLATPGWEDDIKAQGARVKSTKKMTSDENYTIVYIEQDVEFQVKKKVPVNIDKDVIAEDVTIDVTDLVEPVNNALDAIASINDLCDSANDIIDEIRNIENKMDKGTYLNRIYKFLDKASVATAKGIYKLFQPTLLVNSDSGLSFAGIRGVPAEVSGNKVEVIPTTYSNGLVAPVYKKYISVNGANGKVLDDGQVTLDITSDLKTGVNTVEYYAVDYYGNEFREEYVVIKK